MYCFKIEVSNFNLWKLNTQQNFDELFHLFSASDDELCSGSDIFCEYIKDLNNTLSPRLLKQTLWPADYDSDGNRGNSTLLKMAQTFFNNTIIVRLRYKSSEIEFTKLDVRTTMTDKIANFGGTFGIWAELTGVSLLGMINLLIISFKLLFKPRY